MTGETIAPFLLSLMILENNSILDASENVSKTAFPLEALSQGILVYPAFNDAGKEISGPCSLNEVRGHVR